MRNRSKHIGAVLGIGLILAAVRTVLINYGMEKNIYENDTYYLPDNIAVNAFDWLSLAMVVFFIGVAVKIAKGNRFELDAKSATASAASCILAFVLFGAAFIYVYTILNTNIKPTNIGFMIIVLSVASGLSFLLSALRVCGKNALSFIALFPILLAALRLLGDFIRTSATPLASSGAYHISSLVFMLLYFYCEGKSYVNGGSAAIYLTTGYISVILLLVYAVPNLVMSCFGVLSFDYYTAYSAVDLMTAVYICAKMSSADIITPKRDLAAMLRKTGKIQ